MDRYLPMIVMFGEGIIPTKSVKVTEIQGYNPTEEEGVYLDIPMEDEGCFATIWGFNRKAIALFHESDFKKLINELEPAMELSDRLRRIIQMIGASSYMMEYEKGKGVLIPPVLLDGGTMKFQYIERTSETMPDEETSIKPFAYIRVCE